IFTFIDRRPRVRPNTDGPRLDRHGKAVEFKGVCFSYEPGTPILTNISLEIRFGETIAIVGKNGCGKTTLVGLLPRFHDPARGPLATDGHTFRPFNLRTRRQKIGLATKKTILSDDTFSNNTPPANRHAKADDIAAAAQKAFAHEFVERLPQGYQ